MAFELEELMAIKLEIPFVTGYGMTEHAHHFTWTIRKVQDEVGR